MVSGAGWLGCRFNTKRCQLHQQEFYACPKDDRSPHQKWQCGGPESLYCKAWGCETTGSVWWKSSSSQDRIMVLRNSTPSEGDSQCRNPQNITFTAKGKESSSRLGWVQGRTWGLLLYVSGYDPGLTLKIRLQIQPPDPLLLGPNPILKEQKSPSQTGSAVLQTGSAALPQVIYLFF